MNNQEKFATRLSKFKVHRVNSQMISSPSVRFSTDILFSSLVSSAFLSSLFVFLFSLKELKIYILMHIQLCRTAVLLVIKTFSPSRFQKTRLLYFGLRFCFLWLLYTLQDFFIVNTFFLPNYRLKDGWNEAENFGKNPLDFNYFFSPTPVTDDTLKLTKEKVRIKGKYFQLTQIIFLSKNIANLTANLFSQLIISHEEIKSLFCKLSQKFC